MATILQQNRDQTKKIAWLLSLGGLIPFYGLALVVFITRDGHPFAEIAFTAFMFWSVAILAFLGGIRWGFAITTQPFDTRSLIASTLGPCLALFAIFLPKMLFVIALLLLFSMHGAWDSLFIRKNNLPEWFASIRVTLTFLVVIAHAIVLASFI